MQREHALGKRLQAPTSVLRRSPLLIVLLALGLGCTAPDLEATVGPIVATQVASQPTPMPELSTAATQMSLPPNARGQIGLTRTWIPKAIDEQSVRALFSRMAFQLGFHQPNIGNVEETTFSRDGVSYQRWRAETEVGGPCDLMRLFVNALESQGLWPTLVVDEVEVGSTSYGYVPISVGITFHITIRESDLPAETEAGYQVLIADRGPAAAFSCQPRPTPLGGVREEARRGEFHDINTAVTALMTENNLPDIPNPDNGPDAPCNTGTQDMTAFPDSTSDDSPADKVAEPDGSPNYAYPGDKAGYLLFGHDITANNGQTNLVNYINFNVTRFCYTIDSNGTVHQYLEDGTEQAD